jgi:hypothetical protein
MRVLMANCWPRMPSSRSWKVSCFQTTLILPFHENVSYSWAYLDTCLTSSSRQLKRTMQPVNAVSRVAAIAGFDRSRDSVSCFEEMMASIWDREALTTVISDEIAIMVLGASLYLQDKSYSALPATAHVVVILVCDNCINVYFFRDHILIQCTYH